MDDVYELAISSYALKLADSPVADTVLTKLMSKSKLEGKFVLQGEWMSFFLLYDCSLVQLGFNVSLALIIKTKAMNFTHVSALNSVQTFINVMTFGFRF